MKPRRASPFIIGAFVVGALAVLAVALVALPGQNWFKRLQHIRGLQYS